MFPDKYRVHPHKEEIEKKFEQKVPISEIRNWLKSLGEEHVMAGDTLRKYRKRHLENITVKKELALAKKEFGAASEIENYLLETIAQCRAKKCGNISGKDFQYYDQQMQSAIKLLNDIRGSSEKSVDLKDVFDGIAAQIANEQEEDKQQFRLGDTRSLDEVIRELAQMGYITSFCTAGYRCGRTGKCIMDLLRSGEEGKFCKLNAVLTFREWLDDFASNETKKVAEPVIKKEIKEIREKMPALESTFLKYYERIQNGERDLYL